MTDKKPLNKKKSADEALNTLRDELEQTKAALARSQADFINYKRRNEEERADFASYAAAKVLEEVIAVFDNFKRAAAALPQDLQVNDWAKGIVVIEKHFEDTLNKLGVQKMRSLGESYNPELHEAVMRGEGKQDEILEELEAGYKLNGKVLRPAKVKVGDGSVG
ncbi:MAG: nucleotide exchange factor GrpE [Candidatus Gracilibacteria bacterium]|nr:nucleotide exchange factor GrpE [Candidatus Gracilibacteria bacterium]